MKGLLAEMDSVARLITETNEDIGPPVRALYATLRAGADRALLDEAAERLFEHAKRPCPIPREVFLYLIAGTCIEHGATPGIGCEHLLARLRQGLTLLAEHASALAESEVDLDEARVPAGFAPDVRDWGLAFRHFVIAAMARLARSPELRQQARADVALARSVEVLEERLPSAHGFYLSEILQMLDGELLLIDLISHRMELLQVQAIRNCAHLIALLEGADARALGGRPGSEYAIRHHYASFGCLDEVEEGLLFRRKRLQDVDWMFMLGVERSARGIPTFDLPGLGPMRVVVKAPKRIGARRFSPAQFFAPLHDDCVESVVPLRRLSPVEQAKIGASLVPAARVLRERLGRVNGAAAVTDAQLQHPAWREHWVVSLP